MADPIYAAGGARNRIFTREALGPSQLEPVPQDASTRGRPRASGGGRDDFRRLAENAEQDNHPLTQLASETQPPVMGDGAPVTAFPLGLAEQADLANSAYAVTLNLPARPMPDMTQETRNAATGQ